VDGKSDEILDGDTVGLAGDGNVEGIYVGEVLGAVDGTKVGI